MAPTFIVQVFKHAFGSRPYSNVYLIDATDLDDAVTQGNAIGDAERALHFTVVTYDRLRVSSIAPDDDVFEIVPLTGTGDIDATGSDFLPLFNTLRVDFAVDGGGRPSRKYYRTPVTEEDNLSGVLTSGALATWQSKVDTFLGALSAAGVNWVDPDGQAIVSGAVQPNVQMRQLHRRRRRVVAP